MSISIETPNHLGKQLRRISLALAVGIATPLAVYGYFASPAANAQSAAVKTKCKLTLTTKCPKNSKRVCVQTDKQGCCVKSKCE